MLCSVLSCVFFPLSVEAYTQKHKSSFSPNTWLQFPVLSSESVCVHYSVCPARRGTSIMLYKQQSFSESLPHFLSLLFSDSLSFTPPLCFHLARSTFRHTRSAILQSLSASSGCLLRSLGVFSCVYLYLRLSVCLLSILVSSHTP